MMKKEEYKEQKMSCCGNGAEPGNILKNTNLCPVCKRQGTLVKNITVKHMVHDELTDQVGEKDYNLCMSEDCDVTYYNTESNVNFNKQQIRYLSGLRKMQILSMLVIVVKSQKIR